MSGARPPGPAIREDRRRAVAAVDLVDQKLALARELGAEHTFNAAVEDPAAGIQALGGAARGCRPRRVADRLSSRTFRSLRAGRDSVFVALPADNSVRLPNLRDRAPGHHHSRIDRRARADLAETFQLHADGRTRVIRETCALGERQRGLRKGRKGRDRRPVGLRLSVGHVSPFDTPCGCGLQETSSSGRLVVAGRIEEISHGTVVRKPKERRRVCCMMAVMSSID